MSIQANFPAIKPTLLLDFANTEALDPRITFTRASTGTYYDGKTVAKAEENLLLQSQAIGTTGWIQNNSTSTLNNAVAPDGTTTASLITLTSAGNLQTYQLTPTLTGQITMSCYIKTGSITWMQFFYGGVNTEYANFNVSSGTLGNYSGTATITSVGNGWYRCTHTFTPSTNISNVTINTVDSGTAARAAITTASSGTWYLWGAQLEQRSFATAYTPTTTAPITNYIPVLQTASAGTPRFDHNPITGESLGLLIEEQRTNLLPYSQDFDNAAWAKENGAVTSNTTTSPDGTTTADSFITAAATGGTFVQQAFISLAQAYTASFYVKPNGVQFIQLLWAGTQSTNIANFDIINGLVGTTTATSSSITSAGNGWYRVTIVSTLAAAAGAINVYCVPALISARAANYTGNGTDGVFIWGAQLEAGAFATSYIPTVASQVTRAADSASMTGTNVSSWYNQSEGTVYSQFAIPFNGSNMAIWQVYDTFTSRWGLNVLTDNTFSYDFSTGVAGSQTGFARGVSQKVSVAIKASTTPSEAANGVIATSTGAFTASPAPTSTFYIGSRSDDLKMSGTIARIAYYNRRLTNTQLQALTS